jgi:hypothetical protein
MPRYDIPSEDELDAIRSAWTDVDADAGLVIHRLCDAIEVLKQRCEEQGVDDRRTIPTPPPDDDSSPDATVIGVSSSLPSFHLDASSLDEE